MASGLPELPPLDPSKFRWTTSSESPNTLHRRANGTEAWVGIQSENKRGQYDCYLLLSTVVTAPSSTDFTLAKLRENLCNTLLSIRFRHPDIACTATWDSFVAPLITYTAPVSHLAAITWAQEVVEIITTSKSGIEVRADREKKRREENKQESTKSVSIYLIADVANEDSILAEKTKIDILMHFNHIHWDGISARVFAGELLRGSLNLKTEDLEWGNEIENLGKPILDAMREDVDVVALSGDREFNEARDEFLGNLFRFQKSHGLPLCTWPSAVDSSPNTVFSTLTVAQSISIISAIKSRLGPGFKISHLGHAATVLALLDANPLSEITNASGAALVMPLPVDGRRFLRPEFRNSQYGACQAGAVVDFGDITQLALQWENNSKSPESVIEVLKTLCRTIRNDYDKWTSKPFQLALGVSKDNFLSQMLGGPKDPSTIEPKEPEAAPKTSTPVFISDGLNDRYIPHFITAGADSANELPLITVTAVSFFIDTYLADLLVRMESFKGATSFTFCHNETFFSSKEAQAFLQSITGYMLAFTEET